ncbi:AAA domain protein [anaerobic digester metagenome]
MTESIQKKTDPKSSTAIDVDQSLVKNNINIISSTDTNSNILDVITMSELFDNIYPPRMPIIDNFLYEGIYLFVGAPKVGKSFFMAQLAYHVSTGQNLWEYKTHQGSVLYMALEDDYGRLQGRLSKMFGTDSTDDLYFATMSDQLGNGLEEQLKTFIEKYPNTKLVIIDTLQKIRENMNDKFSYANDYEIVTKLKRFTDKYKICLLLVHHTRKQAADDSFDTISGSNGLLGAADGAFILQKAKRVDGNATLDVAGRDQQDQILHLQFDRDSCIWNLSKVENEISAPPPDPLLEKISTLLIADNPSWIGTASDLMMFLGNIDLQPNTLTRRLNINVDRLKNEYGITYENSRTHSGKMIKLTLD